MYKKYNISKPKKVLNKQTGIEKTHWDNIGTMTEFIKDDGSVSRILEIPAIGLNASIFPIEPKPTETRQEVDVSQKAKEVIENDPNWGTPPEKSSEPEIRAEDIPF